MINFKSWKFWSIIIIAYLIIGGVVTIIYMGSIPDYLSRTGDNIDIEIKYPILIVLGWPLLLFQFIDFPVNAIK